MEITKNFVSIFGVILQKKMSGFSSPFKTLTYLVHQLTDKHMIYKA